MLYMAGTPGTDDWWAMRLCTALGAGFPRMSKLMKYRDGDALLPDTDWDFGTRQAYLRFMKRSRLHVVETIRNARTDRQNIIGYRTGAENDEDGDEAAWANHLRNRMGTQQREFFNDTADFGRINVINSIAPDGPLWTMRNEWTSIVETNALRPWLTEAGIMIGFDSILGIEVLTLFRPGYYRVAFRDSALLTLPQDGTVWYPTKDWTWAGDPIRTPWTQDALITQNSTVDGYGVYEKHLDTIDRINEITLNALTLIVMQSFRQRAVKGNLPKVYPEDHPQAGQEIDYDKLFQGGPAALWMLPVGADIWESKENDVTPVYGARRDEIKTLSSLTATPQDMLNPENQSAMGAQSSREPLYHAVRNMNSQAAVCLAQVQSLSFLAVGDTVRADVTKIEPMFGKINPATLAEKGEAASKFKAGGATQRYIDEEVFEMTPQQRRQADQDRQTESLEAALAAGVGLEQTTTRQGTPAGVTGGQ